MANRLLLQTLLRFSDDIKSGAAKVQDVVTDYFNTTGKSVTDEERDIILKEFQDNAPSNVTTLEGVDPRETIMPMGGMFTGKINYPAMQKHLGVTLRGNETFDELLEIEKAMKLKNKAKTGMSEFDEILEQEFNKSFNPEEMSKIAEEVKESRKGLGSLYPKGGMSEEIKRDDLAGFMKAMRAAGIKNKDVMDVAKIKDVAEGKRAATTLARAADMNADTISKQEALDDLDDDIANYGPNWWKGEGYNDGPMGFESYGQMSRNVITKINNGIVDDLEKAGVDEEKVNFIFRNLSDVRDRLQNEPKAFVQKVADELEMEDINYDLTFWNKYVDEIMSRVQKPEPRFADGGLV